MERSKEERIEGLDMETLDETGDVSSDFVLRCVTAIRAGTNSGVVTDLFRSLQFNDCALFKKAMYSTVELVQKVASDFGVHLSDVYSTTVIVIKELVMAELVSVQVGKIFAYYERNQYDEIIPEDYLTMLGLEGGLVKSDVSKIAQEECGKEFSNDVYKWMIARIEKHVAQSIEDAALMQ